MRRRSALSLLAGVPAFTQDWPQFRGPDGQGHTAASGLPLEWGPASNIKWKSPLPGDGWSSPSISGGRIWLTASTDNGASLRLLCLDAKSGHIVSNTEVFRPGSGPLHKKNNPASPTPILDKGKIYVHFGFHGTAAVDEKGKLLWTQKLNYEPQHGPGGSPALFEDMLIISCDGFDAQYVAALDTATGKVRWKTARGKGNQAYTTPLVIQTDGGPQVVSPGAHHAYAYDPRNGKELWYIEYGSGFSNVPRPVYAHGLVYICSGFFQPVLFAVKPSGTGNVTKTHVAWTFGRSIPLTPSPVVAGNEIYFVSDNGIGTCLDARTGELRWQRRLGGNYSASPLAADGRIYFLSEEGEAVVIAPGTEYKELARNQIDERTLASFAVSGSALFLRGDKHLFRIEA